MGKIKFAVLIGRIFFSAIFILASFNHFTNTQMVTYAAAAGVPMANILVPFSGLLAFLGGLSVLLGFKAQWGAWLIVLFLVPVTLTMHKFWGITDPQMSMI